MAKISFNGASYTVDHAVKGADYVHGYSADGVLVVSFEGVSDFSCITYDGTYLDPSACITEGCNDVKCVGGKLVKADGTPVDNTAVGAAAASHGTHVTFTTTAPKAAGTAAVGTATTVSRSDHVHPAQTTISGNAGSATKLATSRTFRVNLASTSTASFDGTANATPGVTGTLPVTNGGTGKTSWAANRLLVYGASAMGQVAFPGTDGSILRQNKSGAPYWTTPAAFATLMNSNGLAKDWQLLYSASPSGTQANSSEDPVSNKILSSDALDSIIMEADCSEIMIKCTCSTKAVSATSSNARITLTSLESAALYGGTGGVNAGTSVSLNCAGTVNLPRLFATNDKCAFFNHINNSDISLVVFGARENVEPVESLVTLYSYKFPAFTYNITIKVYGR